MNDEYNYDKFLSDSGDDYPKYDSGVEFYPYAATKKKDVLRENIALAKSDPEKDYDVTLPEGYEDMDFEPEGSKHFKPNVIKYVHAQLTTSM